MDTWERKFSETERALERVRTIQSVQPRTINEFELELGIFRAKYEYERGLLAVANEAEVVLWAWWQNHIDNVHAGWHAAGWGNLGCSTCKIIEKGRLENQQEINRIESSITVYVGDMDRLKQRMVDIIFNDYFRW